MIDEQKVLKLIDAKRARLTQLQAELKLETFRHCTESRANSIHADILITGAQIDALNEALRSTVEPEGHLFNTKEIGRLNEGTRQLLIHDEWQKGELLVDFVLRKLRNLIADNKLLTNSHNQLNRWLVGKAVEYKLGEPVADVIIRHLDWQTKEINRLNQSLRDNPADAYLNKLGKFMLAVSATSSTRWPEGMHVTKYVERWVTEARTKLQLVSTFEHSSPTQKLFAATCEHLHTNAELEWRPRALKAEALVESGERLIKALRGQLDDQADVSTKYLKEIGELRAEVVEVSADNARRQRGFEELAAERNWLAHSHIALQDYLLKLTKKTVDSKLVASEIISLLDGYQQLVAGLLVKAQVDTFLNALKQGDKR